MCFSLIYAAWFTCGGNKFIWFGSSIFKFAFNRPGIATGCFTKSVIIQLLFSEKYLKLHHSQTVRARTRTLNKCKLKGFTAIWRGGLRMGGFCLVVQLSQGGSATNRATPSSLQNALISSFNFFLCLQTIETAII